MPISTPLTLEKGAGYSLQSTMTSFAPISSGKKIVHILLFPILWPLKKLYAKMAPTKEELERFENLIEKALGAGKAFIDNQEQGEKELKEVIAFANSLYTLFSGKWMYWTEGIVYLRAHLTQITMRLYALAGDEMGVKACRIRVQKIGYEPRGDIESQLDHMRTLRKPLYRPFFKMGSGLIKIAQFIAG